MPRRRNYTDWLQDSLINENEEPWLKRWSGTPTQDPLGSAEDTYALDSIENPEGGKSKRKKRRAKGDDRATSCIDQSECAAGFSCSGGFCVQSTTQDSGGPTGCGTGGTGGGGDFGCIEVNPGTPASCVTGTCGNNFLGGAGAAEYCCGEWVCAKDDSGELKCSCQYGDFGRCNVDTDCPEGQICSNGFCYPDFGDCDVDSDCLDGYRCSGGFCVLDLDPPGSGFGVCETDEDCLEGYKCVDGFCLFDFPNCEDSAECGEEAVCVSGFCFPGCQTEVDCDTGLECVNGFCTSSCDADDACQDGNVCIGGFCLPGCRDDEDCPEGYECTNGFCLPLFDVCTIGADCNASESCLDGFCFPGFGVCGDDDGCLENQVCINGFCIGYGDLPDADIGIDFENCAEVQSAPAGTVYTSDATTETNCFSEGFVPCGSSSPVKSSNILVTSGNRYVKNENGLWYEASCVGDGSGIPNFPNPGGGAGLGRPDGPGGGGGGGGGGGFFNECDTYCDEKKKAGMIDGDECGGFPTCDDCKVCKGGICTKPEDNIPCYCNGGYPCGQCEKCSKEDGGCVAAPENCRKCCKTCTNGCEDGFTRCLIRCAPMDFTGFLCKYPDCPDPGDDPPRPEPCDCNFDNDCPECYICNAACGCVPDPSCGGRFYFVIGKFSYTSDASGCPNNQCMSNCFTTALKTIVTTPVQFSGNLDDPDDLGTEFSFKPDYPVGTSERGPCHPGGCGSGSTALLAVRSDGETRASTPFQPRLMFEQPFCDWRSFSTFTERFFPGKLVVVVGYGETLADAIANAQEQLPPELRD